MKIERAYQLAVVGGGLSGMCTAIAAARHGVHTALIQDRPMLGGNASSEIKMHITGADRHGSRPEARETGIIEELQIKNRAANPQHSYSVQDLVFYDVARATENLDIYLNTRVYDIVTENKRIVALHAQQMTTEKDFVFTAPLFADCTGDAFLAARAGATVLYGRESRATYGEPHAPEQADDVTMGNSIMFVARDCGRPMPFTPPAWAKHYTDADLRFRGHGEVEAGYWWIEAGGLDTRTVWDAEEIRDELLAIVMGIWAHLKREHPAAENYALEWFNFLPGKRESRRILCDYTLTELDIAAARRHDDDVAYGGWSMDIHIPGGMATLDREPTTHYEPGGKYGIPYRSTVVRNVDNLWVGGRAIGASHMAFGSTRVMATCGVVGQAIGTAAALAVTYKTDPRGVLAHIDELRQMLLKDDCYIPGVTNADPLDVFRTATVESDNPTAARLLDGYGRDEDVPHKFVGKLGETVSLRFAKTTLGQLRFKFDSDLSKELTISITPAIRNGQNPFPAQLAKSVRIECFDGEKSVYATTVENAVRLCVVDLPSVTCDRVTFSVDSTYGADTANVYEVRGYRN